jgi:virginiamycin B lyase
MMSSSMRRACAVLVLLVCAPALAATQRHAVTIKEWPVPWPDTHPTDPFVARPDAVWFVGSTGHYLAMLNPQTGAFKRIDLIDEPGPQSVIVAANGMVWFSGTQREYIGRFDPVNRRIAHFPMSNDAASDPSRLMFERGERNIWFTAPASNIVGRLRLDSGVVDLLGVPRANAHPEGMASDAEGTPWFALSGTSTLAKVSPLQFAMTAYPLKRKDAQPRRIAFTSDGRLWYTDFAQGYLGVFTPATKEQKEWRFPGGKDSHPLALAVDSRDHVWAVETGAQPSKLIGFDPKTEKFFGATAIPSGGGTVSGLRYDTGSGGLWFGTQKNTIGFAKVN